jgi:hypothetical protein
METSSIPALGSGPELLKIEANDLRRPLCFFASNRQMDSVSTSVQFSLFERPFMQVTRKANSA